MEAYTSCMRNILQSFTQYDSNPCDTNVITLTHHLEAFLKLATRSKSHLPSLKHPLLPQCIACFIESLNKSKFPSSLAVRVMDILKQLSSNPVIRDELHSRLGLTACLAFYLPTLTASATDPTFLMCLQLLHKVTYNCRVSTQDGYVEDLLVFAVRQLRLKESELTLPCLGLLDNLSRHSYSVQLHLKNMPDGSKLAKSLILYTSHNDPRMVTFSLAVLSSVWLHDPKVEKIFGGRNMNSVLQLLFPMVLTCSVSSAKYVVDFFCHFIRQNKVSNALLIFPELNRNLGKLLKKLSQPDADISKIFELLLSFCSVNGLRCSVCNSFADSSSPESDQEMMSVGPGDETSPFTAVLHWASQSVETHDSAPLLALDFLSQMIEELCDGGLQPSIESRLLPLMSVITETLEGAKSTTDLSAGYAKVVKALRLALAICAEPTFVSTAVRSIPVSSCVEPIENQLQHNPAVLGESTSEDWWEDGVDVVLFALDLMFQLRSSPQMDEALCKILADPRLVPFLSVGMTSDCRERVHASIDALAQPIAPLKSDPTLDSSVESLISQLQDSLVIQDVKNSDLFSIYEHRLQTLQTRMNHMQDLLDASTARMSQAEKLATHYRCTVTHLESDCKKLRTLVQNKDKEHDGCKEKYAQLTLEKESVQNEVKVILEENRKLQKIADEYQLIVEEHADLRLKLENSTRSIASLHQENSSLVEKHELFQRHNDALKTQLDSRIQQIGDLEVSNNKLKRDLEQKTSKERDLTKSLNRSTDQLKKVSKERDDFEIAIGDFRQDLANMEEANKKLIQQVQSLKVLCSQRETEIRDLKQEIEKHNKIAAMIHNLSNLKDAHK
uniref:CIP2A N-terminal domain-containing protein n=1 Tax=Capitella teleta TaxID=283909 RepID=X2B041_CAPTE